MPEPFLHWSDLSDAELERALLDLGPERAYPPTPDLTSRVRRQLETEPPRTVRFAPIVPRHGLWLAAAIILLAVGISLLLVPQVRSVIADRLGLRGVVIRWEEAPPQASPVGARLMLGQPVTLEEVFLAYYGNNGSAANPVHHP